MQFTETDLKLGQVYWDLLVRLAKEERGRDVQYAHLIAMAKEAHPDKAAVQNAIPVSIGRRLDVVHWFCEQNRLPDLACLAVGKAGMPGERYLKHTDWYKAMAEVRAFDWTNVSLQFDDAVKVQKEAIRSRPKRTEDEALAEDYAHYTANKVLYVTPFSAKAKSYFVKLLREGLDAEEAFKQTLSCAHENTTDGC
jgi:predicted DNA-binding ribbon-helix-helix protein